ncbi:DNA polymerase III subunit gamma/tau [Chloroflexota bacterium]
MTSQVFYRKWRPQNLASVVGQETVTRTLLNALSSGRISHAYLFCGPRGTGKTSTGRILAKSVNCLTNDSKGEPCNTCTMCLAITEGRALDVIEVDAASNRRIDEIRDLREKVRYAPNEARYKVYIIDEVHMLTTEASNALLKTLEEPPPHVIFVLATTEAHKILPTIMSRCQRFDFRRLSQRDVSSKLRYISGEEGINIPDEALMLVSKATSGSLRDAENLLQQLATYYGNDITRDQVQELLGGTGDIRSRELVASIVNMDTAGGISTINSVAQDGVDLRQFGREVVEYLRALLLIKTGAKSALDMSAEDIGELSNLADMVDIARIVKMLKSFGGLQFNRDHYTTLPLELALVECSLPPDDVPQAHPVAPAKVSSAAVQPPKENNKSETPPAKRSAPEVKHDAPEVKARESKAAPAEETPARVSVPKDEEPASQPEPPATKETGEGQTTSEPPEPPADASDDLGKLWANWRHFIQQAPDNLGRTPAAALLRSARPRQVENKTVVLSFRFPMHKDNMEKTDNRKIAEKIISHFLGRDCRVECIYEPEQNHMVRSAMKNGAELLDTEEK